MRQSAQNTEGTWAEMGRMNEHASRAISSRMNEHASRAISSRMNEHASLLSSFCLFDVEVLASSGGVQETLGVCKEHDAAKCAKY
jgi:hypothetical protein